MSSIGCQVCLSDAFNESEMVVKTACDHYFCSTCIESWHKISKTCPTCRGKLNPLTDVKYLECCPGCKERVFVHDMTRHLQLDCRYGSHKCPVCNSQVANADRERHAATHFDAMDDAPDDSTWIEEKDEDVGKNVEKLG